MSHFNLNNGMPRKRYIGPTHGLPCRPGTASLENLGGRIIIENEMSNHKLRLKQIKPSIDASKPWAHDYQDSKIRKMSPSRMSNEGGVNSPSSTSLPPATAVRSSGYGYNPNRSNSSAAAGGGGGGSLNSSKGKSSSSPTNGRQQHGGGSNNSSAADHRPISFDVTALSPEHQKTYTDLVQLLSTLPQRESKSLLEQAYREGEERKLLMAYTGGFPDAKGKSGSHHHDKKDEPKKRGDNEGTKGKASAVSHERSGHTAVPFNASDAASDAAPSHSPSSSSTTKGKAVGGNGGLSSSQLLRKKVLESSAAASKSDADDVDISHRREKHDDHDDDERMGMSGVSAHSRPSTRGSVASVKRHDDNGDDSFEKDDDE